MRITATTIWQGERTASEELRAVLRLADGWEIQLPGNSWMSDDVCCFLRDLISQGVGSLGLCAIVSGERLAGKQHPRTRVGYASSELIRLDDILSQNDLSVDRVLCRVFRPWEFAQKVRDLALDRIGQVDLSLEFSCTDDSSHAHLAAEAVFSLSTLPGSRVYLDPFIDMDRTMDASHGLLNTLCNPRPAFHVVRCLNTVLFRKTLDPSIDSREISVDSIRIRSLRTDSIRWTLIHCDDAPSQLPDDLGDRMADWGDPPVRLYHLADGTVEDLSLSQIWASLAGRPLPFPILLASTSGT